MIKNNMKKLHKALISQGYKKEAKMVKLLYILAAYDNEWRPVIDRISRGKKYPFSDWFQSGSDREIIDLVRTEYELPDSVEDLLYEFNLEFSDYLKGYVKDEHGRDAKIGKLMAKKLKDLQRQIDSPDVELNEKNEAQELITLIHAGLEAFRVDENRGLKGSLAVVISQNPHDVAQASYDREWTSCFRIGPDSNSEDPGIHADSTFCEVKEGGLVAYLIQRDDIEIKNPKARLLIRRFVSNSGVNIAKAETTVYGNSVPGFEEAVDKWLKSKNPTVTPGRYQMIGGEYSDSFKSEEYIAPNEINQVIKWLEKELPEDPKFTKWIVEDHHYDELGRAGFWDDGDPFNKNVIENYNYYDWDASDNEGEMSFDSEEEADDFLNMLKNYGDNERYVVAMLESEGTYNVDLSGDELDEKYEELMAERFSVTKVDGDRTADYQRAAVKKSFSFIDKLGYEELDIIEDFLSDLSTGNNKWPTLRQEFYVSVPNRLSPKDFIEIGAYSAKKILAGEAYYPDSAKPLPLHPRKKEAFIQAATLNFKKEVKMDLRDWQLLYHTSRENILGDNKEEMASEAYGRAMNDAIRSNLNYFNEINPDLEAYFHEFIDKLKGTNEFNLLNSTFKILEKDKASIFSTLLNNLTSKKLNVEQNYKLIKKVMESYNPAQIGYDSINIESVSSFVSRIGVNEELAAEFIPIFEDQLKNIELYAEEYSKLDREGKPVRSGRVRMLLRDKFIRIVTKQIDYVLDSLTNGKGYSTKYRR